MEGKQLELTVKDVTGPSEKGWYKVKSDSGRDYGTKNAKIMNFIGKTAIFMTNSTKNAKSPSGWSNYINDPLPELVEPAKEEPQEAGGGDPFLKSKENNTLIMCAKDLVCHRIMSSTQKELTNEALASDVYAIYEHLRSKLLDDTDIPF